MKQKLVLANLVYGQLYPNLWIENQVKSLCDPTNLPALKEKYDIEYVLLTDEPTLHGLSRHPNFMKLNQNCRINTIKLNWPPDADQFGSRYGLLTEMLRIAIPEALKDNAILGAWVADLVFAKEALPRMLAHIERGHDAVFMVPIRSAADSVNPILAGLQGAPTDMELFEIAYRNLHHLWVASQWNAPQFTRMPYSILWNSYTGLVAHNLGITPILFKPSEAMKDVRGGIDSDLPGMCKNPYWATDWIEAPVAGVEPLSNGHYPPFAQSAASISNVSNWALRGNSGKPCIFPNQIDYLDKPLFYPSKKIFADMDLSESARDVAERIQTLLRHGAEEIKS